MKTSKRKNVKTLSPSFSQGKSSNLKDVESEYIKNLQQQIYFLELETNFLRNQAKKATDIQPRLTQEASNMMARIKDQHHTISDQSLEIARKEASVSMLTNEKERYRQDLQGRETAFELDRNLLREEIIQLKKMTEVANRDIANKDAEIVTLRQELERVGSELRHTRHNLDLKSSQLDQRIQQHTDTVCLLDGKRSENVRLQSDMHAMEEKFYTSTTVHQEQITRDLKVEIRNLRQQLKQKELTLAQERILKDKLVSDTSTLTSQNASLHSQVIDLTKQMDRERFIRDEKDARATSHTSEIAQLKGKSEVHNLESRKLNEIISYEKNRCNELETQLLKYQDNMSHATMQSEQIRQRLAELEGRFTRNDIENNQLRHDKQLLVQHTAKLQRNLDQKESEILRLQSHIHTLQTDVSKAHSELDLTKSLQSVKF